MQIKNIIPNSISKEWLIAIKIIVLIGSGYFVYGKVVDQSAALEGVKLPDTFTQTMVLLVLLMMINWSLEAWRWKISVAIFESISFSHALAVVLNGLALNLIFPLTTGDVLARLLPLKDKFQATSAMVLNRGVMLCLTLVIGVYGASELADSLLGDGSISIILFIVPLVLLLVVLRKRLSRFYLYFTTMSGKTVMLIVIVSVLRYSVFLLQFYLIIQLFNPMLSAKVIIGGIGWIFLSRSMLPTVMGGLGVREASGILYFAPHVENVGLIVFPVFLIWMVNTLVPSIAGLVSVWKFKLNIAA